MTLSRRLGALQPLTGIVVAVIAAIAGRVIRNAFIEPERMGAACEVGQPWWCGLRAGLIAFTQMNGFGWVAVGLAIITVAALLMRRAPAVPGTVALLVAGLGISLYNASFSIAACVVAVLALAQSVSQPRQLFGHREPQRPSQD